MLIVESRSHRWSSVVCARNLPEIYICCAKQVVEVPEICNGKRRISNVNRNEPLNGHPGQGRNIQKFRNGKDIRNQGVGTSYQMELVI